MNANVSRHRRQFIGDAARWVAGLGVAGAAGAVALSGRSGAGDTTVSGPATALEPAERLRSTGEIAFPVAGFGAGELRCLNNFKGFSNANGVCGHVGVDVGVDVGGVDPHPLVACVDGVVESTGFAGAPGRYAVVYGDDGRWYRYHHLGEYAEGVEEGVRLHAGDVLGTMGSTGNTSWRHLHFEVWVDSVIPRDGTPLDPVGLMPIPAAVALDPPNACST